MTITNWKMALRPNDAVDEPDTETITPITPMRSKIRDFQIEAKIGAELRKFYQSVLNEPIPENLLNTLHTFTEKTNGQIEE